MIRKPVISSNLVSVGYDAAKKHLDVEFKSGGVYRYKKVPKKVYESLITAFSAGTYLATNIKGKYEYERV